MRCSHRRTVLSVVLFATFLMFGGLVAVEKTFAGPLLVRVTGTFLSPGAAKGEENVVVFYYRGVEYPFMTDEVRMLDPKVKEAIEVLRRIGKPYVIVYGGDDAIAAIGEHGTVGNKYTLEGLVYAADRIFQLHSSTFMPKPE